MQSPHSENRMSMRVCHIRHTLFLSFSMVAYFFLSAMQLPLAVNSMHCNCSHWPLQTRMFCVSLPCVFMRNNYFFLSSFRNKFNIKRALSAHQSHTLLQKKRFSRRFVQMQKGVACECWQNEYLFEQPAICTLFRTIWCKMECVLVQNGVRFGAKRSAFWC